MRARRGLTPTVSRDTLEARHEAAYGLLLDSKPAGDPALADYDCTAEDQESAAITAKWAALYARYAEDFTQVVEAEAAAIEGLSVPVTVVAVEGRHLDDARTRPS